MAVSRGKNAAFTLVEMLVVITILGILMALLLPAVNSVRESMRRTQCKNNLKQLGDAAQAHLAAQGYFPSGGWGYLWTGDPDHGFGAHQPGGWIYNCLPYLGLDMIHDKGKGASASDKYNTYLPEARSAAIPVLICPTRRKAITYPSTEDQINAAHSATVNKTDYAANGGSNVICGQGPTDLNTLTTFPASSKWELDFPSNEIGWSTQQVCSLMDSSSNGFSGVSGIMSEVSAASITDGLSNAFFAGEKYLDPNNYYNGADKGDSDSCLEGNDHDVNRWVSVSTSTPIPPMRDTRGADDGSYGFGSAHAAGLHFVFCDGHVQLLSFQVDPKTYQCLGVRNYLALNPGFNLSDSSY